MADRAHEDIERRLILDKLFSENSHCKLQYQVKLILVDSSFVTTNCKHTMGGGLIVVMERNQLKLSGEGKNKMKGKEINKGLIIKRAPRSIFNKSRVDFHIIKFSDNKHWLLSYI